MDAEITHEGMKIPVTIIYSAKRRTVGITVKQDGKVVVHAPEKYSCEKVISIASEKAEWIVKHRTNFLSREPISRAYAMGDILPFYDRNMVIQRVSGSSFRARIDGDSIIVSVPDGFPEKEVINGCREAVVYLYRREGLSVLRPLIEEYSSMLGVEPPSIRIRVQDKKWGCCTPNNGIIFNVKIFLAPSLVVRYLVVHELCHILHRDHQPGFWREVQRLMPEYREAEALLKSDGWKWIF